MNIQVNVKDTVQKPEMEVFDAIVNPDKLSKYFTSHASSELVQGKRIEWEFEDVGVNLQVEVIAIEKNNYILFNWKASGQLANVCISLAAKDKNLTTIQITEGTFERSEAGVQKALQQTQGWTNFICSLKAYLYTGVNLRNGRMA